MRLLIVTPLYPPDIAPLAVYVKEFSRRSSNQLEVTILAYAHIPEEISGVRIVVVPKDTPLPFRLLHFTWRLWHEARKADVLFIQNGASVELPMSVVSLFTRTPRIVQLSDSAALTSATKRPLLKSVFHFICVRATHIIHEQNAILPCSYPAKTTTIALPHERPEILPLKPYPTEAFTAYEQSWENHIEQVTNILNTYAK